MTKKELEKRVEELEEEVRFLRGLVSIGRRPIDPWPMPVAPPTPPWKTWPHVPDKFGLPDVICAAS